MKTNGRSQWRSRSSSDKNEARREVVRIVRKVVAGQSKAAQKRSKDDAIYAQATQLLRPTGTPLLTAVSCYAQAVKILGGDRILEAAQDFARHHLTHRQSRTVRQVADELVDLKTRRGMSHRYLGGLRHRLDKISEAFAGDVAKVSTAEIQGWLDRRKVPVRTLKSLRDAANALFKFAEARGYIAHNENPVVGTQRIGTPDSELITICTPNELRGMLAAAPGWFRPVLAIQAFAGLRSAEMLRLDWENVKLDVGHIEVGTDRTKAAKRLARIPPNLVRWLAHTAKSSGKVFPYSRVNFDEIQASTAKAAEIAWKHNVLRHSFISYRVAQSSDVPRVSLECGISPGKIFKHYRTLVGEMEARQWFIIVP
jgi:integrase